MEPAGDSRGRVLSAGPAAAVSPPGAGRVGVRQEPVLPRTLRQC